MKSHKVNQGTTEWFELRIKHPLTASKAQAISAQGAGLKTLCIEKLSEKYSSEVKEKYTNKDLERGVELEEQARAIYELQTGNTVKEVGFITDSKISKLAGVSPDGLVDKDGMVEIKCFADKKHFEMIIEGITIEKQYMWQMQMQLLFTGREWNDFVVFNPNFPDSILVERVFPDSEMQDKIVAGLVMGEEIINLIENKLKK